MPSKDKLGPMAFRSFAHGFFRLYSKIFGLQKGDCPGKTTLCKYCATHVEQGNLVEHENYCGSRTEKCEVILETFL